MSVRRVGTRRGRVAHCPREEWLTLGVAGRQRVTYGVNDRGFANPFARRGHFVPDRFGKEGVRSWNTKARGARRWLGSCRARIVSDATQRSNGNALLHSV